METSVKVWDWSLRVFHWSLPVLLFLLWFSATQSENFDAIEHHMLLAQILLGLMIYRIIWGFIGTPAARFSRFITGPRSWRGYAMSIIRRQPLAYMGHNPLGGLMVLVLLGALSFQLLTGLFTDDDILFSGPLASTASQDTVSWMSSWHRRFFDWILILIGVHLLAIVFYKLLGEGLVKAMFTGRKPLHDSAPDLHKLLPVPTTFPWIRFCIAVAITAACVGILFYR
ncbi:cytochrome b/b6 domain-containing protein [Nitrincola iocasae]|jgi:cytochrome b|uniref:Cytochrome B n=1 Tax=Nitrincola iocasae TaxID=2614693 RepID=A0A5J6LHF0_9GAMM|nr:cytochrome b/b6 domain-containing protein [Nitrincola iocasae]QEW08057.1 cytochrome B [Nitrincola iocasae]